MDFNKPKKEKQKNEVEQTDSPFVEFKKELKKILERKLEENGF